MKETNPRWMKWPTFTPAKGMNRQYKVISHKKTLVKIQAAMSLSPSTRRYRRRYKECLQVGQLIGRPIEAYRPTRFA